MGYSAERLIDGQTIRLLIERNDPDKFVTIPEQAIVSDQAGRYVFAVGQDGTVEQRRIKIGQSRDGLSP